MGTSSTSVGMPGSKRTADAGGDVQPLAVRGRAVEVEAGVGLGEVVVGADLDGAVGGVEDGHARDGEGLR